MTDDFEDFREAAHPLDKRGDVHACRWCDATFDNYKALSLHETGSHREETCTICGVRVGLRGLRNHTRYCQAQKSGAFDDMLPTDALRARLRDWLERANEPVDRDDVYCMACEEGDPEFVRDIALADRVKGRGMCWLFPACKIDPELFRAPPRRDRRTGFTAQREQPKPLYGQEPLRLD